MKKDRFYPDPELVKFAIEFAENYKILTDGDYYSDNNNYCISYSGIPLGIETGFRYMTSSKNLIVNTKYLNQNKCSSDFVFYSIISAISIVQYLDMDIMEYDKMMINYFKTTPYSIKKLAKDITIVFRKSDSKNREERLRNFIKKQERKPVVIITENRGPGKSYRPQKRKTI